ncbi:MAG: hypothetical protein EAZ60_23950 [Oscillatoriales cyanobacterium]|nr:MAG: hypothetical protein EAZ83_22970 [Oscillatoriales cyanobacterium]TAE94345.1 MAG: hypothetical protein EAZ79_23685 [Oscillatoriales cyanobacterium]TAF18098.1 MAG: hypothetical protein EAZ73_19315 [Oscillatoriales cyanobacterium]TAF27125.1 MAG: hypothetical protein EAZ69_28340 [Oscillatoriales cyanobacterium]TAF52268.1 MAG: hypothetical protein EAZ60_23950 [Oscillatoriales cyanobacterium]
MLILTVVIIFTRNMVNGILAVCFDYRLFQVERGNRISFRDPKECDRSINLLVLLRVNSEAIAV